MRTFFLTCLVVLATSSSADAESQSLRQHGELVTRGTITDRDDRVWSVRFIPGTRKIHRDARHGWTDAGDSIAELGHRKLWADSAESVTDGLEFSRDVVTDHFAEGIVDDVESAIERNAELRSGDFGRGFIVTWNWLAAGTTVVARTVWVPLGTTGGVAYAAVAPVARVLWQPVEAVGNAAIRGVFVPVVVHLWNGTAWTATFLNAVPERETRWVKRERSPRECLIDRERFMAIVHSKSELQLHLERRRVAEEELARLQAESQELNAAIRNRSKQTRELDNAFQRSAASRNKQRIEQDARHAAEVRLGAGAEALMKDESALDELISEYLRARATEPSDELVNEIRDAVQDDVDQMVD